MNHDFSHVETWVFDLDNTLYPPSMRLFDQIEAKMTGYVMRELGLDRESPPLPEWIRAWIDAEVTRPWPPSP